MGLFTSSAPAQLKPHVQAAINSGFREDLIGPRPYRKIMAKIGAEQEDILRSLGAGELLALIAPCSAHGAYEGLLVLTNRRVMDFKNGSARGQMTLDHVVRSTLGSHPGGFMIIQLMGRNYVPYSPGMNKYAFAEYQRNHIQVNIEGVEAARHAINIIDGACGIRA